VSDQQMLGQGLSCTLKRRATGAWSLFPASFAPTKRANTRGRQARVSGSVHVVGRSVHDRSLNGMPRLT
jgi:hypothetical protein